jgi:uroporphyrinogen-III synthase
VGRRFWLTRPEGQGSVLGNTLAALGAELVNLPLLEILPLQPSQADKEKLLNLDRYDLVFYVSTNAARIGLDAINQWWPQYPSHIRNFAVGPATAAVLEQQGLRISYPEQRMTSEAMLALPELQHIKGKKALIVRGVGGREIIAEGLLARGASIDYAELYDRSVPKHDPVWLQRLLQNAWPDAVVISSGEALDNLKHLLTPLSAQWQQLPLAVSSPRLAEHAVALGFAAPRILPGAGDATIIAGLVADYGKQGS